MWQYFRKGTGRWYIKWRNLGSRKMFSKSRAVYTWEQINGTVPKGYEIHHINFDRADDRIENLQLLSKSEHRLLHAKLREDHREIDGIECRRCQNCGEYKSLENYYTRTAGTFGGYCKTCSKSKLQEWRRQNKEHHNEYHKQYRKSNKV